MENVVESSPWAILAAVVAGGALAYAALPDAKERAIRKLPVPASTLPVLGNSLDLIKYQNHRVHDWIVEQCLLHEGRPWRLQLLGAPPLVVLSTQEAFEDVLKTQFEVWDKGQQMYEVFADVMGDSIAAVDGEQWRYQRKKLSHLFTMRSFRETITTSIQKYVRVLGKVLDEAVLHPETPFNLGDACHQMAFDIFAEVGFGLQTNALERSENNPFIVSLGMLTQVLESRFQQPKLLWKLKRFLQIGEEKKLTESLTILNDAMHQIIYENLARQNDETYQRPIKDVISLFMDELNDEDNETDGKKQPIDSKFLRDVGFTILAGGKDSTASSLMWCFVMLGRHPDVENKIREELQTKLPELFTDKDYVPSLEEIETLVYLEAALRESLRLNPTVPLNAKEANRDTTLSDGTFIKKGTRVYIPSYALARMPHVWGPDAAEYKPERWIEVDELTGKQKLIVVPATKFTSFHAGPRICLGMRFALFELKAALAYTLSKYRFKTERDPASYTYEMSAVLPLKGPLMVSVGHLRAKSY
ncbi:Cytochrome p450 [Globisporangium polare]